MTFIGAGVLNLEREASDLPALTHVRADHADPSSSNFVVRPVTLTLRLLCNMISGHRNVQTAVLLHELSVLSTPPPRSTGTAMFIMTGFQLRRAPTGLIFTILSTVYIKLSIEHH